MAVADSVSLWVAGTATLSPCRTGFAANPSFAVTSARAKRQVWMGP